MTIPKIIPNDHPVWKFRVAATWSCDIACPAFDLSPWADAGGGQIRVNAGYCFDGVTSPILKQHLDRDPRILAAALIHDVILQAKREIPAAKITWADTVTVWKATLRAFNAPLPGLLGAAVAFWFNPIFNKFRK